MAQTFDKWRVLRGRLDARGNAGEILQLMADIEAEEARQKPPEPTLKPGDMVRHKDPAYGTGIVRSIAKSGLRALVDFDAIPDWDKKKMAWAPVAYYRLDTLELVEEAPQS